jgi:hypothetical protein
MAGDTKVDAVWIDTREFAKRTRGMSACQIGQTIADIIELSARGLMSNGPVVRIEPPEFLEGK